MLSERVMQSFVKLRPEVVEILSGRQVSNISSASFCETYSLVSELYLVR